MAKKKAKLGPDIVAARTVKMELPVALSAKEVNALARDFASHHSEYVRIKDEYKIIQRQWRDRIRGKEGHLLELGRRIDDECRNEMIDCVETYDFTHDRIRVVRQDTGETVAIREASAAEKEAFEAIDLQQRQGDLLGDDAASSAAS